MIGHDLLGRSIGVDSLTARRLATVAERVAFAGGQVVFEEGAPSDALYVVERGRFAVEQSVADGESRRIGEHGHGEVVGEIGVLTGHPRSATVVAVRDSVAWRVGREAIEGLSRVEPAFGLELARQLALRLADGERSRRPLPPPKTIAILDLSRGEVDVGGFARELARVLPGDEPLLLDRGFVRTHRPRGNVESGADQDREDALAGWLGELEEERALVVYVAEVDDVTWTRRCLRQADTILLIAGEGEPSLRPIEQLTGIHRHRLGAPRVELVRVFEGQVRRPRGTGAWLRVRRVARHHHLRRGRRADLERLARFLVGAPIGVVLGGGGARGLAHVGVLRAFADLGVPVDVIAGTSSGAIVATLFAAGIDPSVIVEHALALGRAATRDVTLPVASILSGRRLGARLREVFTDRRIEDTWLPCFLVSADLFGAEMVVHESGSAWEAARASISVPGLFPPVRLGERLLVDGAVVNNLPSDEMRERCPSAVIMAFDSSIPRRPSPMPPKDTGSGWRQLLRRLRGRAAGLSIIETVARGFTLGATRQIAEIRRRPDMLYTQLPVGHIGLLNVRAADELIATGYRHGCALIRQWRAAGRLPDPMSPRTGARPRACAEVCR